jgi:hypothetical protein
MIGGTDGGDLEEVILHPETGEPCILGVAGDRGELCTKLGRAIGPGEIRNH